VTATVKELSITVARLAAQPRLTEAGRQPAASVAQNQMSRKFFLSSVGGLGEGYKKSYRQRLYYETCSKGVGVTAGVLDRGFGGCFVVGIFFERGRKFS